MPDKKEVPIEVQLLEWKKHYKSVSERCKKLEAQVQEQDRNIMFLSHSLKNAQTAVQLNKDVLLKVTEEHNKKEKDLIDFMNKLKAKLREMGYDGNFDNLG